MSIIDRLINLTKASANEILSKLEDPVMMMNQYIRNMQEDIERLEHELASQKSAASVYQKRLTECLELAEQYEAKATAAVIADQELEARQALDFKLRYTEQAQEYVGLHRTASEQAALLEVQLDDAKAEYQVLLKKREDLAARLQKTTEASQTNNSSFSKGIHPGSAAHGFERIEAKLLQMEAELELASKPYSGPFTSSGSSAAGVNPSSADNTGGERGSLIDAHLNELRKKLQN